MGGKKKLSLKKMERKQRSGRSKKTGKTKGKKVGLGEKDKSGIIPPDPEDENVINEVKKIRVLTPYNVASRFNVRMSVARDLLKQLEERGVVQIVSGNHNLKIYKPAD
jgi:small subunit ribosomal protein S25e